MFYTLVLVALHLGSVLLEIQKIAICDLSGTLLFLFLFL